MPVEIDLVNQRVAAAVAELGLSTVRVETTVLDPDGPALFVTIISNEFDGQAHLDRELHIRPAVIRALHSLGLVRATTVIEPLTEGEQLLQNRVEQPQGLLEPEGDESERVGRQLWRARRDRVLAALASVYRVDELQEGLYLATREGLADERIALGFALSPKSSTLDISVRNAFQTIKNSQKTAAFYYLTPQPLTNPLSNQQPARWIEFLTDVEFLHKINSSINLSQTQATRIEQEFRARPHEERGPVISPDVRTADENLRLAPFFEFVRSWSHEKGPSLLILMAPAGHGKTTLTKELTRQLSNEFLASPATASVPLFVPFEEVRRTVDFDALMHKKFAELKAGAFGAFKELLGANAAILVVDGFDELADDAGFSVAENQVRSMRPLLAGNSKVILAGRSVFTHQFGGEEGVAARVRSLLGDVNVQTLEILPFEEKKIREYVMSREGLALGHKQAVLDFAQASADNEYLCSNPLFLRIVCSLAFAGGAPAKDGAVGSVDSLVEQVCDREEQRQNLGIGTPRQIRFLEDLASEAVMRGGPNLPVSDVRIIAKLVCEDVDASEAVVEKLVDHAFLTTSSVGKCAFIHPLVRDVLAGRSVVDALSRGGILSAQVPSKRDLPFGTTQYVARAMARGSLSLPAGWTRSGTDYNSQLRRNLFRLSCERVRYQRDGDPREWRGPEIASETQLHDLDLSRLVLDSISLDGLTLNGCDLSESLIEDCDLRATVFSDCELYGATFLDCRADQFVNFPGSSCAGVEVRLGSGLRQASTCEELRSCLQTQTTAAAGVTSPKISAATLDAHSERLLKTVLRLLVSPDGTKFFELGGRELRFDNESPADKVALERVVAPIVISKLCQTVLQKRSQETHSIAKHWKRSVGVYMQTGQTTPALDEVISRIGSKAARFLEGDAD